eukprot:GHVS01053395.1.p1 GENE.GHVS01053395.1~~GHVS01053395.1.p1  ORF type:complete len:473 (-),score=63.73 GHVS01053395.1:245-1663(-)
MDCTVEETYNQLKQRSTKSVATTPGTTSLASSSSSSSPSCSVCLSASCSCVVPDTTEAVGSDRSNLRHILCVCGIYVFFMSFAFAQEHIYLVPASTKVPKFTYSIFLVFIMCISNALVSYLYLLVFPHHYNAQVDNNLAPSSAASSSGIYCSTSSFSPGFLPSFLAAPFRDLVASASLRRQLLLTSISYVLAMVATNYALTHVNYPTQVLVKSAKMVPVVVGGFLVFSKTYPWYDYVSVALVTTAIGIFNFLGSSRPRASSHLPIPHIPTGVTDDVPDTDDILSSSPSASSPSASASAGTTSWGLVLLVVSLVCDGLTGPRLDKINGMYKHLSSVQIMCFVNVYAVFVAGVCMLLFEGIGGISYAVHTPSTFYLFLIFCISATMGQFCIFFGLQIFGSLYLTFITTTRKFFTVVFSVLWFQHHVTNIQWLCMFLVFASLTLQSCFSKSDKISKRKVAEAEGTWGAGGIKKVD